MIKKFKEGAEISIQPLTSDKSSYFLNVISVSGKIANIIIDPDELKELALEIHKATMGVV